MYSWLFLSSVVAAEVVEQNFLPLFQAIQSITRFQSILFHFILFILFLLSFIFILLFIFYFLMQIGYLSVSVFNDLFSLVDGRKERRFGISGTPSNLEKNDKNSVFC